MSAHSNTDVKHRDVRLELFIGDIVMKLLYQGKTKDVYELDGKTLRFQFTDRVTKNDAGEIDPGGNKRADATISGQAKACLQMTSAIFKALESIGIKTQMLAYDLDKLTMDVKKADIFNPGLEWICRWVATGSFLKRYKSVPGIRDGAVLPNAIHEITLKDDDAGDPLIVPSAIQALGILSTADLETLQAMNKKTMEHLHKMFKERGLALWDIKIEWGRDSDGNLILIDEISPGSCRAFGADGKRVNGVELAAKFV
jgi:phosphoribosylaminoimidazole-succinocarboxamide synthase